MRKWFIIIMTSMCCITTYANNTQSSQPELIQLAELISKMAKIPEAPDATKKKLDTDKTSQEKSTTSLPAPIIKNPHALYFEAVSSLDINIDPRYINSPQAIKLRRMLGIKRPYRVIHLIRNQPLGQLNMEDNIISGKPRSFVGMLEYLSNGVEVPPCVIEEGLVSSPKYPDGTIFNLSDITKDVFLVHMGDEKPKEKANVVVYYRNHWFWICDNDIQSKRTLGLVQQIYNFLSGNQKSPLTSPILTIPVK